jgi:hypothetical protein
MFEPQRHRDTEKTQSHPPIHVANTKTRRHKDITKATHPPLNAEARRRRGVESPREFTAWRGPGRRTTARDRCAGLSFRSQAIVAVARHSGLRSKDRRPRHSSSPIVGWKVPPLPNRRERRRNRRAPSAAAGGAFVRDKRSRVERTNGPPAVRDRQIVDGSAVNLRHCLTTPATNPSCLRVFVFATWVSNSAPLRLCVSAFLPSVFLLCVSVSLWFSRCLGGSPGRVGGKFEIRNSKFEI